MNVEPYSLNLKVFVELVSSSAYPAPRGSSSSRNTRNSLLCGYRHSSQYVVVVYSQIRFLGQRTLVGYVSSSTFDALWRLSTVPGTVSKALTTVTLGCVGRPLSEVPPIY